METPIAVAEVIFDKKSAELSSEEDIEFYCTKGTYLIIKIYDPKLIHDYWESDSDLVYTPLDIQDLPKYEHLPHIKCAPKHDSQGVPCITALDDKYESDYRYITASKKAEEYMRIKREYLESKKGK
jgi:hypothetical protein